MENSMEWLSNDVCEGFANCGISVDGGSNNVTQSFTDKTHTNIKTNFYESAVHDQDFPNSDFTGNGIICGDEMKAGHCNLDYSAKAVDANQTKASQGLISKPKYEVADSSMAELPNGKKREQKRRPKPKDGSVLICQICGDKALGYNFDAITCESCKAFFRRNALKAKVFTCSFEGNCKLDQHTRKFCSGCRLKKCFDVGMKKDWILSDDQLAKRRKKSGRTSSSEDKMYHDEKMFADVQKYPLQNDQTVLPQQMSTPLPYLPPHKMESSFQSPGSCNDTDTNSTVYFSDSTDTSNMSSPLTNFAQDMIKTEKSDDDYVRPLDLEIEAEIRNLEKEYASVFDSGYSEDQAKKMVEKPHNANDLFNMTDIFIRRLIKFAKHIPEFKSLKQEDQIYLLKGGIMEIMVLRSAMGFDPANHKWKVKQMQDLKEHNIDPSIIKEQLGTGMYTEHVKFVKTLHQLTMSNNTIMTLMFVIEIFSPDRPNVKNVEAITQAQEKFTHWLQMYLESIMPVCEARTLYPKLLMMLLDVRNLGESSAKLASHLDITKLEPLLIEVFNLQK